MLVCVVVLVLKPRAGRPGGAAGRALNLLSCLLGSKLLFSAARRLERPREAGRLKDDSERGDLQRSDVPIWGWKQAFLPRRSRFTALAWSMVNPRDLRAPRCPLGSAGVPFGPEQIQAVFWRDRRSQCQCSRRARQLTHITPA